MEIFLNITTYIYETLLVREKIQHKNVIFVVSWRGANRFFFDETPTLICMHQLSHQFILEHFDRKWKSTKRARTCFNLTDFEGLKKNCISQSPGRISKNRSSIHKTRNKSRKTPNISGSSLMGL